MPQMRRDGLKEFSTSHQPTHEERKGNGASSFTESPVACRKPHRQHSYRRATNIRTAPQAQLAMDVNHVDKVEHAEAKVHRALLHIVKALA